MKTEKFTSKDQAEDRSEELKNLWDQGIGLITGPFVYEGDNTYTKYWEVTVSEK